MREYVVHQILDRSIRISPGQEIISEGNSYTFEKFYSRVIRLAYSLHQHGVKQGEVIGVLDVNTHRFLELHYALSMLGAIIHTINFRLPLQQLLYTMRHAEDKWIFFSERFLEEVRPILKEFPNWVIMNDNNEIPKTENINLLSYENLIEEGKEIEPPSASKVSEGDIYSIFYTTGTTGKPKGIRYKHKEIILGTLQLFHHLALHKGGARVSSRDVFMPLIPFFHIHAWGMAFFPIYIGAKVVLAGASTPSMQVRLIKKHNVSWLNMVPTQLHMLLQEKGFKDVKVLTGGSPFISGVARAATQAGIHYSLIYGGSDQLGTAISVIPENVELHSKEALEWLRVGMRPIPMVDVSLRDEMGREVPRDGKTLGEIWVRSPWLPEGYYKDEEKTKEAYIDGWFKTGDIGIYYPNGLLYVADRVKDAIKSGGEWIPTGALEALISEHPLVEMVAVIPMKDKQWGERPLAIIKVKENSQGLCEKEIKDFLLSKVKEGSLAKFWIPDKFIFVDTFPITSAGKLDKKVLRKRYSSDK